MAETLNSSDKVHVNVLKPMFDLINEKKLTEQPIFSIIIPVYNTANYLKKCLDSVANQTLKNIEVIVIDDGSTDYSLAICNKFSLKYNNFRVYTKKNEGQGVARNFGLDLAIGKYICFVDSDDWIVPELCFDCSKIMEESCADFLNFGIDFFALSGKIIKKLNRFELNELSGEEIFYRALIDDQILSIPWNKVYNRQLLNDYGIRFPQVRANEDIYFSRAVSRVASKTVFVPTIYYHALVRPESTTRKMSIVNFLATEDLINFEYKHFFCEIKNQILEDRFHAHVIKLFSFLLIQAAFRVNYYPEYIACFGVAKRCCFFEYSSNADVIALLKRKNKWMVKVCLCPLMLRLLAVFLKTIRVNPY